MTSIDNEGCAGMSNDRPPAINRQVGVNSVGAGCKDAVVPDGATAAAAAALAERILGRPQG